MGSYITIAVGPFLTLDGFRNDCKDASAQLKLLSVFGEFDAEHEGEKTRLSFIVVYKGSVEGERGGHVAEAINIPALLTM